MIASPGQHGCGHWTPAGPSQKSGRTAVGLLGHRLDRQSQSPAGVPDPTAHLAGELGVLAFKRGYAEWSEGDRDADDGLAQHTLAALALDELRAASASPG